MTKSKNSNKTNKSYNLSEISRKLKKGERAQIANELGVHASTVSRVLNGVFNNTEVLKYAQKLTARRK